MEKLDGSQWKMLSSLTIARKHHAAVAIGNEFIYVFGGGLDQGYSGSIEKYTGDSDDWAVLDIQQVKLTDEMEWKGVCADEGEIFLCGTREVVQGSGQQMYKFSKFNVNSEAIEEVKEMPEAAPGVQPHFFDG